MVSRVQALAMLQQATNGRATDFVQGQWEAIDAIANRRERVLLVQRTGWGKSMVYFLSTRVLRDQGSGPTLIISPLLALMRNQVAAATGLGLRAETINSTNPGDWDRIMAAVVANQVDLILVSPERLASQDFMDRCLLPIAARIAFFVIDEAHCISDWGHDFRPDYQRIDRILRQLPANVAVLATTATANDRVVADVLTQLGPTATLQRGPLARASLQLQTLRMPDRAARLSWLVTALRVLPGSGIIYVLTTRDGERVSEWLAANGIDAPAYHAKIEGEDQGADRVNLEERLLRNEVKALVATNSLGMGFDKSDLGFVIHFQAPQSIVHYYQQVGRAGRGLPDAVGVLLGGEEDDEINDYFINNAFPPSHHVEAILAALAEAENGLSVPELTHAVNLRKSQIDKVLKILSVADNAPIIKRGTRWYRTPNPYVLDRERILRLRAQRQAEAQVLQAYIDTDDCLMQHLAQALNDPDARACGRCANCLDRSVIDVQVSHSEIVEAARFIKRSETPIEPRRRWESGAFQQYGWQGNISPRLLCEPGKALAIWRDAGWSPLIEAGKAEGRFSDELVEAFAEMVQERWTPQPAPTWVTCVPSLRSIGLVPDFSARLAARLGLPFHPAVEKVAETERQRNMMNSWQQASNLDGAFAVREDLVEGGPVLLVDDIADSRWSLTVIGALLREAGSGPVFPCVLALASGSGS